MTKIKTEWLFIVNPRAGSGKTMSQWVPAERLLDNLGVRFDTVYTTHRQHAVELASNAASQGYRRIAAVGGDGSAHEVFNGVLAWCDENGVDPAEFYLSVVPIGSGNDWIKSFNVPNDTKEVVKLIAEESFVTQDVVRVTAAGDRVSYMLNIGGVGFDSHVCERVNTQKEAGMRSKSIYLNALLYTIRTLKTVNVQVLMDDRTVFSRKCYSIAMGTGRYSGGRFQQVPKADPDDGILDVMLVPKIPLPVVMQELPHLIKGDIDRSENVVYLRGRHLQILPLDAQSADIVEMDGEIVGKLPVDILVTGQKINVLCRK